MIYNVPARTGQDIEEHTMLELAEHENFIGVKECEGNERIARYSAKGICWLWMVLRPCVSRLLMTTD